MLPTISATLLILAATPVLATQQNGAVTLMHVEISQSIQDEKNSVRLIAGRATIVRFYFSNSTEQKVYITGQLKVDGVDQLLDSFSAPLGYAILDSQHVSLLSEQRNSIKSSLNFLIPGEVTRSSTRLRFSVLRIFRLEGSNSPVEIPCIGCVPSEFPLIAPTRMKVVLVGLGYRNAKNNTVMPRQIDYDLIRSWLKRAFPVAFFEELPQRYQDTCTVPSQCIRSNSTAWSAAQFILFLLALRQADIDLGNGDESTRYYGIVSDGNDPQSILPGETFKDPLSPANRRVGTGPAGDPSNWPSVGAFDVDSSYGDWYAGHELGHQLGRDHPRLGSPDKTCLTSSNDDNLFPFPSGRISSDQGEVVGFDIGDPSLQIRPVVMTSWGSHDVMAYCDYPWPSRYTYEALLDQLVGESVQLISSSKAPNLSFHRLGAVAFQASTGVDRRAVRMTRVAAAAEHLVNVIGSVDVQRKSGEIRSVSPVIRGSESIENPSSPVRILALDERSVPVRDFKISLWVGSNNRPDTPSPGIFSSSLKVPASARKLQLVVNDVVVSEFVLPSPSNRRLIANLQVPDFLEKPQLGSSSTSGRPSPITLTWKPLASERPLRYIVQININESNRWDTLAADLSTPTFTLDSSVVSDAAKVKFRVIASDGINQFPLESKVIRLTSAFAARIKDDVKWAVSRRGCRLYAQSSPGSGASLVPTDQLRRCFSAVQTDAAIRMELAKATDSMIQLALADAAVEIPIESNLKEHFAWVCQHKGQLGRFLELASANDFEEIRRIYSELQSHDDSAKFLLAAVSDEQVRLLLAELRAGMPASSEATTKVETFRSDYRPSGVGKNFSDWYVYTTPDRPGWLIDHFTYDIEIRDSRQRGCATYGECSVIFSDERDITMRFRIQGDDSLSSAITGNVVQARLRVDVTFKRK